MYERNIIACIMGDLGSGKTLFMTTRAYLSHMAGVSIISNYHLGFPHKRIEKITDLDQIIDENIDKAFLFVFDEPFISLDSRASHSKLNIQLSQRVLQSRKMNMSILYSARFIREVELRLRAVTNWIFCPNIIALDEEEKPLVLTIERHKRSMQGDMSPRGRFMQSTLIPLPNGNFINSCDLYATEERINKIGGERKIDTLLKPEEIAKLKEMAVNKELNKTEMKSLIALEHPGVYKTDAEDLTNYIFMKARQEE